MKKTGRFSALVLAFVLLLQISAVSAIDLTISEEEVSSMAIIELNKPAVFQLTLTNNEDTADNFEIYSLVGVALEPKESFWLEPLSAKTFALNAYPREVPGYFSFEYKIKNSKGEIETSNLAINIVNLKDAFRIYTDEITPDSDSINLYFENKDGINFEKIEAEFSSVFFERKEEFSLAPKEKKAISVALDKEKSKGALAGSYILNSKFTVEGQTAESSSLITFSEQSGVKTTEIGEGFLLEKYEVAKENKGNMPAHVEIVVRKNVFADLFTTFNIAPTGRDTIGASTFYIFEKTLMPGDALKVTAKTNWWILIIVVAGTAIAVYLIVKYSRNKLKLVKRVSFVKTKGGEFALKINLVLKPRDFVERIKVIDRIPGMVKIYERYGTISPDKVDEKNKRLEWSFDNLNKNEERVLSYIIYSKMGVFGKFELPEAKAIYEYKGKVKEITSNRAFYIHEPGSRKPRILQKD